MGVWESTAEAAGGPDSVADGGPDMEPCMPEFEELELVPELREVDMVSSLASSLSDFNTRSP
jgi:hypothetical protein